LQSLSLSGQCLTEIGPEIGRLAKLNELNANQLKNLMRKGVLARAYLHLVSLDNFARLLERRAARGAAK